MCSICNKLKGIIYCLVFPINLKIEQGRNPGVIRVQGYSCNEIKILLIIIKLGYHEYMCWVSWNFGTSNDSLLHGSGVDCFKKNKIKILNVVLLRTFWEVCHWNVYRQNMLNKKGAVFIPWRIFHKPKLFHRILFSVMHNDQT